MLEVVWGGVGDGEIGEAGGLPREPMVAVLLAGGLGGARDGWCGGGRHDKDVDDVFAAAVDEGGSGATGEHIEAAAEERKAVVGEVADGGGEVDLAVEPRFYGVLVGGRDIHEMAGLQRAEMGIDGGGSEHVFVRLDAMKVGPSVA